MGGSGFNQSWGGQVSGRVWGGQVSGSRGLRFWVGSGCNGQAVCEHAVGAGFEPPHESDPLSLDHQEQRANGRGQAGVELAVPRASAVVHLWGGKAWMGGLHTLPRVGRGRGRWVKE